MGGIIVSLVIVINFVLQTTLFKYISIAGVLPNTALLIVVSFALIKGNNRGAVIGFFCGLLQDMFYGKVIGINMLIYMIIGYIVGYADEKIFRDSVIVPILFTSASTVFYYALFLFFIFFLRIEFNFAAALRSVIIPEAVYNSALVLVFFRILYRLEKRFNEKYNLRFTKN